MQRFMSGQSRSRARRSSKPELRQQGKFNNTARFLVAMGEDSNGDAYEAASGGKSAMAIFTSSKSARKRFSDSLCLSMGLPEWSVDIKIVKQGDWRKYMNDLTNMKATYRKLGLVSSRHRMTPEKQEVRRRGWAYALRGKSKKKAKKRLARRPSTCLTPYVVRLNKNNIVKGVPKAQITLMLEILLSSSESSLKNDTSLASSKMLKDVVQKAMDSCFGYEMAERMQVAVSMPKYKSISTLGGRISALNGMSRALILNALMKRNLSFDYKKQRIVSSILLSCHGEAMLELKDVLDSGGEYHNLHKLVWQDVWYSPIRSKILAKIKNESVSVMVKPNWRPSVKVICDVDDTLICSAGRWPAGLDKQIPRGVAYPGALQFYAALGEHARVVSGDNGNSDGDSDGGDGECVEPAKSTTSSLGGESFFGDDESEQGRIRRHSSEGMVSIGPNIEADDKMRRSVSDVNESVPVEDLQRPSSFRLEKRQNAGEARKSVSARWQKTLTYARIASAFRNASKSGVPDGGSVSFDGTPKPKDWQSRPVTSSSFDNNEEAASKGAFSPKCSLYFVTARPHAYKQISEIKLLNMFKAMSDRLHCTPALTTGELHSSVASAARNLRALIWYNCSTFLSKLTLRRMDASQHRISKFIFATRAWRQAGVQKFRTYLQYLGLYPESKFIFIGDNGQADNYAAEIMANMDLMPDSVVAAHERSIEESSATWKMRCSDQFVAAFVHKVQDIPHTLTHFPGELDADKLGWIESREKSNIYFFETYVEAAMKAYGAKPEPLIDIGDLYDISYAAVVDCWKLSITHPSWAEANSSQGDDGIIARVLRDCELVNQILNDANFPDQVNTGPLQVILSKGKGLSTHDIFFLDADNNDDAN